MSREPEQEWPVWLRAAKPPPWLVPRWAEDAPPVLTRRGEPLDRDARHRLWHAVERGGATRERFGELLDPDSLRAHVWALFSGWAAEGADMTRPWVFEGLEMVLDDELAWKLGPMVESWIHENEKSAAKAGLDVLVSHGTSAALSVVSRLAQRFHAEGFHNLARNALTSEAARRGLSLDELEDRLVPSRALDAETMLSQQRARLERALSTGRDWSVSDWNALLREHPLMRRLTRRLVWGQYDATGALERSFRVDEENVCTEENDEPIVLDPELRIRLVHPVDLASSARAAWGELFSDYEMIPPFAQLARPVKKGHSEDMAGDTLRRVPTRAIPRAALHDVLNRLGWIPGEPDDHVRVRYFAKRFDRAGLYAVLTLEPGFDVAGRVEAPQTLSEIYFLERAPGGLGFDSDPRVLLGDVPASALSEALYDAGVLAT